MADITREEIQEIVDKSVSVAVKQIADIFSEYAQQNDERFTSIDERFTSIDARFTSIDERFSKIDHRFDRLEGRMDQLEADVRAGFDRINSTLDGMIAIIDTDDVERVAISAQVTRHENWIVEAAPTTGVKYTPGA